MSTRSHNSPDFARSVQERQRMPWGFRRFQAPNGLLRQVPLHLEMVDQTPARPQNPRVLLRRALAEITGTNIRWPLSDRIARTLQPVPCQERFVNDQIAPLDIFDEERRVGH